MYSCTLVVFCPSTNSWRAFSTAANAAFEAILRARSSSRRLVSSLGSSRPLSRRGSNRLAPTSDTRITAAARKITRSRAGNGSPPGTISGRVSTPARVIAPRTPATDIASTTRPGVCVPFSPRMRALSRLQRSDSHTKVSRITTSMALMASTYTTSHHALCWPLSSIDWIARSTMPGNCSPSSTKMMPLKVNCTMLHTALRCTRMLPLMRPVCST
ncbi:hypothetical protein D3C81_1237110 [compost metagenome]